ncbi:hypothetical protein CROQUDRAFT_110255 [Cronartium quercuum f. sp. fusiforme G11]|uniref:Uncharacterized protein n=1 Tax=Cronartium quercuum f. sp. fusiforme G11 TaxID=708437 RepID=A0A9P6T784_9BASI|nr:hypothetical protein CROQUDRAFT_110255 [Cronartium quercuum f. sp. fusiforme G11]
MLLGVQAASFKFPGRKEFHLIIVGFLSVPVCALTVSRFILYTVTLFYPVASYQMFCCSNAPGRLEVVESLLEGSRRVAETVGRNGYSGGLEIGFKFLWDSKTRKFSI